MRKGPTKPIVVASKPQILLQFFDACRVRLVFHRLYILLIYLQIAITYCMPELLHLRLTKFTFLYLSI